MKSSSPGLRQLPWVRQPKTNSPTLKALHRDTRTGQCGAEMPPTGQAISLAVLHGLSKSVPVHDVTRILDRVQQGDPKAAEELLPLVYGELRRLAAYRLANERSQQTLQPTSLVHEAW